jgi:hypothetical protein
MLVRALERGGEKIGKKIEKNRDRFIFFKKKINLSLFFCYSSRESARIKKGGQWPPFLVLG